jgi:hypothetical protein
VPYGIVVAVVAVLLMAILGLARFRRRPKKYQPEQEWPGRKTIDDAQRAFLAMDTPISAYEMTWLSKDSGVK